MRIAHLTATFPPNWTGAGNTCLNFARRQAASGHEVEVFTVAAAGKAPDAGGAVVHRYRPRLEIGNAPLIPDIARLRGFDVVHLHYPFIFGVELVLAGRVRSRGAALVVSYKNRLVGKGARRPLFWAYEQTWPRRLVRQADRVCVLSPQHAESVGYLRRLRQAEPEKVVEMPNGVDAELFSPGPDAAGIRSRLGIPSEAVVAIFAATLDRAHHFKRLDLAIDAIAGARNANLHLLVAGGGELLDSYKRLAAERLGERAHFAGPVPHSELPDVMRAGDFLLLSTEPPESFGIVLIEAMACGLPVVATDYPGATAVIDDGRNGVLAPVGDAARLQAAIERVTELKPDQRKQMGKAGRAKAEHEWSWARLVDRMDRVYREAVDRRKGAKGPP